MAASISRHGHHQEHLIVDWSSSPAVQRDQLPDDPRLRLVRVEREALWWLTRAYNHGFALARCPWILKVDADQILERDFFAELRPAAADLQLTALPLDFETPWREADATGLFCIDAALLRRLGGFNPHLVGWGYDDLDLYQRAFSLPGVRLARLPITGRRSLPHSDQARVVSPWGRTAGDRRPGRGPLVEGLARLRLEASLEANRWAAHHCCHWPSPWPAGSAREIQGRPGQGSGATDQTAGLVNTSVRLEASARLLHDLPAGKRQQRQRALLSGFFKRLLGRYRQPLLAALPVTLLPLLLRAAGVMELPPAPPESSTTGAAPLQRRGGWRRQ